MSLGIHAGTSAAQSKEGECACCVSARISPALLLTFQSCNTMREGRRTSQAFVCRGLTIEVKPQNTSKQQCNNGYQHSLTRRTEGKKKDKTAAGPQREITAQKICSLIRDIIEDSSEDKYLIKSVASPQQITRNNIW